MSKLTTGIRRATSLLLLLAAGGGACGATRVDLDADWAFQVDASGVGETSGWIQTPPAGAERVSLPHTWNRPGPHYDYLGVGWYFRDFDLPKLPADASVQLHFGATFYQARVWVNGVEVGAHEGGYSAYSFDITRQVHENNRIAVAIDNRPAMIAIPGFGARGDPAAWYDWWDYGGITRGVWLSIHGPLRVDSQFLRTELGTAGAVIKDRVSFVSTSKTPLRGTVRATAHAPDGSVAATQSMSLEIRPGTNEAALSLNLAQPQLWDLDHPNLYRMTVELLDPKGRVLESHAEGFGIRNLEIRDRHLLLNGARLRLTGMTRHADSPWEGAAETAGSIRHDWEDMRELGMHLTRPVHYAPDPLVLDFADSHGILLIPEIPVWQASEAQMSDPRYQQLAKQQLRELIMQAGNHPSVFAWSVANESATGTPGGIAYFRAMRDFVRGLDPTRPVTFADDNLPKLAAAAESAAKDADFLMMNEYFGAWHGPREALSPALDKVDRLFPDKMVIISEFGFPGIFAKSAAEAEQQRVSIFREQLPELAKRDFIAGAIMWCYQDYTSRRFYWPGQEDAVFDHGVVDANRQRKSSYFAWKELNEPAKIDARWTESRDGQPSAFSIAVLPNNPTQLPSLPLVGYVAVWQLIDGTNHEFARGMLPLSADGSGVAGANRVPAIPEKKPFRLRVTLQRPDGSAAALRELLSPAPVPEAVKK
jgi:beta-glucuronidase